MHFELILYMVSGKVIMSFFSMWISRFPGTISQKDRPFPVEWPQHHVKNVYL